MAELKWPAAAGTITTLLCGALLGGAPAAGTTPLEPAPAALTRPPVPLTGTTMDDTVFDADDIRLLNEKGISVPEFAVVDAASSDAFAAVVLEDFHSQYEGYDREFFYAYSRRQVKVFRLAREQVSVVTLRAMVERKRALDQQALATALIAMPVVREYWAWQKLAHLNRSVPAFDFKGLVSRPGFAVDELAASDDFARILESDHSTYDGYDSRWFYAFAHDANRVYRIARERLDTRQLKEILYRKHQRNDALWSAVPTPTPIVREHREWLSRVRPDSGVPPR